MEKWVMSIVGIVALGVLVDIIVPEGEINKYIKSIFSIMTICVIVAPLPTFLSNIKNDNIEGNVMGEDIIVDETFVNNFYSENMNLLEHNIERLLVSNGLVNAKVTIKDGKKDGVIDKIVIESNDKMDKKEVNKIIRKYIKLDIKEIVVYEKYGEQG